MKRFLQSLVTIIGLIFATHVLSQEPAPPSTPPAQPSPSPAPAPAPSPTPAPSATPSPAATPTTANPSPAPANEASKSEIPVISIGDQVKPMKGDKAPSAKENTNESPNTGTKKIVKKSPPSPKIQKVDINIPLLLEAKQLVHSRISQIGDEVVFVVAENYPNKGAPLLPKGSIVVGKISAIERIQKDQPGGIRVTLEAVFSPTGAAIPISGVLELARQKGQDNFGGKEAFIPVGIKLPATLNKRFTNRVAARPARTKAPKGLLSAPAQMDDASIQIKLGDLKYPTRLDLIIEGPQGMEVTDLQENSIKIVRVNDFTLPRPLIPLDEKIKVADRNKNKVKDISYKFQGWELIRYLPEGTSTLVINAQTKNGKPVEITATVNTEYR